MIKGIRSKCWMFYLDDEPAGYEGEEAITIEELLEIMKGYGFSESRIEYIEPCQPIDILVSGVDVF